MHVPFHCLVCMLGASLVFFSVFENKQVDVLPLDLYTGGHVLHHTFLVSSYDVEAMAVPVSVHNMQCVHKCL